MRRHCTPAQGFTADKKKKEKKTPPTDPKQQKQQLISHLHRKAAKR
jgi:hypothetical protein